MDLNHRPEFLDPPLNYTLYLHKRAIFVMFRQVDGRPLGRSDNFMLKRAVIVYDKEYIVIFQRVTNHLPTLYI